MSQQTAVRRGRKPLASTIALRNFLQSDHNKGCLKPASFYVKWLSLRRTATIGTLRQLVYGELRAYMGKTRRGRKPSRTVAALRDRIELARPPDSGALVRWYQRHASVGESVARRVVYRELSRYRHLRP